MTLPDQDQQMIVVTAEPGSPAFETPRDLAGAGELAGAGDPAGSGDPAGAPRQPWLTFSE